MRRGSDLAVGLTDQAVASLTNVAVIIVAARNLGVDAFGTFALAATLFALGQGLVHSIVGDILAIRSDSKDVVHGGSSMGAALVVSGAASGLIALFALVSQGRPSQNVLLAAALGLTPVCMQMAYRTLFGSVHRPRAALANDTIYGVLQVSAVILVANSSWNSASAVVLAWAGAACLGTALAMFQTHSVPHVRKGYGWLVRNRELASSFSVEYLTTSGASFLVLLATPLVAGVDALAGLRVMQSVFGPLNVLTTATRIFLIPRLVPLETSARRREFSIATAFLAITTIVWTLLVFAIPDSIGEDLFGSSWSSASELTLWFGLQYAGLVFYSMGYLAFRLDDDFSSARRIRLVYACLVAALPLPLAFYFGAAGVASGLAFAAILVGVLAIWMRARRGALSQATRGSLP